MSKFESFTTYIRTISDGMAIPVAELRKAFDSFAFNEEQAAQASLFGDQVGKEVKDGHLVCSPSVIREGDFIITPLGRPGDVQAVFYNKELAQTFVQDWNATH